MSRFLFVVPPFAGHVNPTVSVAAELTRRGHGVAWTGLPGTIEHLLPAGHRFFAATAAVETDRLRANAERSVALPWASALKFLWDDMLLPLARVMTPGVDAAVERFEPDALVVDQQAFAGAVVARTRGLPWATSATTSAGLVDSLAAIPTCAAAVRDALVALQIDAGVPEQQAHEGDLRLSPELVLAYTTSELAGLDEPVPSHYQFVGPCTTARPETATFPWEWLDPSRPTVLVTLGTLYARAGERFFPLAAEVLGGMDVQAVLVAPADLVPSPPADVLVRPLVPQLALLPHVDAVVSHAGHNTVCEALAAGVPLVVAPIRDDQPIVADQVVRAGAGVRVRFGRLRPAELEDALYLALFDPVIRAAAQRLQRSFAEAGGPASAADHLELLARSPCPA